MKKLLPIIIFITVFAGFLTLQIVFDYQELTAGPSSSEKNVKAHYESLFKKTTFTSTKGEKLKLSELKAPIVIMNFWASWCLPCIQEFPSVVEMKKKFSDDKVRFIAINGDESDQLKKIKKLEKKLNLNFDVIADKNDSIMGDFLVESIPYSIIFKNGKAVSIIRGVRDFNSEEMIEMFKTAINDK